MPWLAVDKEHAFEGPDGKAGLLDPFDGRRQLIVYRFFYDPGMERYPEAGCGGCSFLADQVAHFAHLNARDTTLVFVSRAPQGNTKGCRSRAKPADAIFGRTSAAGREVLCTNPAALGGGSARITPIQPREPFAPGTTIAAAIGIVGVPLPKVSTTWAASPNAYRARCSTAGGTNALVISPLRGAPVFRPRRRRAGDCIKWTRTSRSGISSRWSATRRPSGAALTSSGGGPVADAEFVWLRIGP